MKMKNFQKLTFVVIALLSHTAFAGTSVQKLSPQQALLQGLLQNNLAIVETAIKNGANVNTPDQFGTTPLMMISLATTPTMPSSIPYLVSHGASLTAKDPNGCTPLDYAFLGLTTETIAFLESKHAPIGTNALVNAINRNHIPEVEKLLQEGANPNLALGGNPLLTLLICGTTENYLHIAELLLKAGSKINEKDCLGQTSLLDAVQAQNLNMVTLLIRYKADVNIPNPTGMTPLINAVGTNNLPVIQALIAAGAKTTVQIDQKHYSDTALLIAASQKFPSLSIIEALLKAPDIKDSINIQDNNGYTALMWAIFSNNLPIIQALITAGAKTTPRAHQTQSLVTALLIAAGQQTPSLPIIEALLKAPDIKDSINLQDATGWTPLMWAASANNLPIIQALITAGAKTTPQNNQANNSATALIIAISQQTPSLAIVQALLQATDIKDSINLQSNDKWTPLMWATSEGNLPIVKALLTAGANIKIATPQGQTAWSVSAANCKSALQEAYNTPLIKANTNLLNAIFDGDLAGINSALAAGANPNVDISKIMKRSLSLLTLVAGSNKIKNHTAIAQALIAAIANHDFQDYHGATALIIAASDGNLELVNSLLTAGANPNFQTNAANFSATALTSAAIGNFTSVVEALAKAPTISQSINKQDSTGATVLIYAAQAGNTAMVKALASIKGINANIQDNTGMTALMYASSNNNETINGDLLPLLKLLVKIPGINLNVINNHMNESVQCGPDGCAALDYALSEDYYNFLTNSGANPTL